MVDAASHGASFIRLEQKKEKGITAKELLLLLRLKCAIFCHTIPGKSAAPTDAKRSLRDRQAPGDGSPLAYQPVACHPPWKGRGIAI